MLTSYNLQRTNEICADTILHKIVYCPASSLTRSLAAIERRWQDGFQGYALAIAACSCTFRPSGVRTRCNQLKNTSIINARTATETAPTMSSVLLKTVSPSTM